MGLIHFLIGLVFGMFILFIWATRSVSGFRFFVRTSLINDGQQQYEEENKEIEKKINFLKGITNE